MKQVALIFDETTDREASGSKEPMAINVTEKLPLLYLRCGLPTAS